MPPKSSSSSTKKVKDPNAPKKAMTSYVLFANDMRPKLKATQPDLSFGEVAKTLGAEWKKAKPETKDHYDKLAAKGKDKYESDLAYYSKHGCPPPNGYASGSVASKPAAKAESKSKTTANGSSTKTTNGKTAAATNGKSKKAEQPPVDESGDDDDDDEEDGSGSGSDEEDDAED